MTSRLSSVSRPPPFLCRNQLYSYIPSSLFAFFPGDHDEGTSHYIIITSSRKSYEFAIVCAAKNSAQNDLHLTT